MDINGMAHVILTVRDFAACSAFYERLLPALGMKEVVYLPEYRYWVGGRTALGFRAVDARHADAPFDQGRAGLHHLCFRARERADVDAVHDLVRELADDCGGRIVHAPKESTWAPGYYSVLFEDPDGIRLEINHVPGKGLLNPAAGKLR